MSLREALWTLTPPVLVLVGLKLFQRARRNNPDGQQMRLFKARLPNWVRRFESYAAIGSVCTVLLTVIWSFLKIAALAHIGRVATSGPGAVYLAMGVGLISLPLGLLCANLISWLLPSVRAANLKAMEGLEFAFWTANTGLIKFGAVTAAVGLAFLALDVIAPWRG